MSRIEGTFRTTSEGVMRVLRASNNKDSLMALLEAFVHDPLITWRLLAPVNAPTAATAPAVAHSGGGDGGKGMAVAAESSVFQRSGTPTLKVRNSCGC